MAESATALGAFLRARRGRIGPMEAGLPDSGRRRTPGLRREEVAQLAGVSVDYYTRLEQGRSSRPSPRVIAALARALMLSTAERVHLAKLAGVEVPGDAPGAAEDVPPLLHRLLETVLPAPAYVIDARLDLLAWNRSAAALFTDFAELPAHRRNVVWLMLRDETVRSRFIDPDASARLMVTALRRLAGGDADDARASALVGELRRTSPEFRAWWGGRDRVRCDTGCLDLRHPGVGRVRLDFQALALPDGSGRLLTVFTAQPESPDQAAVELLASLAAD
ncbi:helix-turn-helix transcriptional regulator [Nocardiopsis sediminis]|uniref:Helix-turn-helix transcriptional regulator n=1 Tax=Nocardiopsis sediminis TaxID=1778267 RepID=A0ABV8FLK9_9ACTN